MIEIPHIPLTSDEQEALTYLNAAGRSGCTMLNACPHPTLLQVALLGHAAADLLWRANLRLAMSIAMEVARQRGADVDDLFQEGCLALREAIRRFDPTRGYRLSTFAHEWISREIRNTDASVGFWVGTTKHYRAMRLQLGSQPDAQAASPLTLAHRVDPAVLDGLSAADESYDEVDASLVEILELMAQGKQQEMMRMRFGFGGRVWSQAELAEHFKVSRSTISRWERRALTRAREALLHAAAGSPNSVDDERLRLAAAS